MSLIFLLCFVNVASFWSTISLSSLFFLWRASSFPFVWVKTVCQSLVVYSSSIWVPWSANFVFTFLICSNTESYSFLNCFASSCFINSSNFLWTKSSDHYVCIPLSIYSLDATFWSKGFMYTMSSAIVDSLFKWVTIEYMPVCLSLVLDLDDVSSLSYVLFLYYCESTFCSVLPNVYL